jgi:hypothetical protein
MNNLLPEEMLCGVFSLCDLDMIHLTSHKLHKIFYKMRMNPAYSDILDDFKFSGSPISPYSEVLATALFNLQYSRKITWTSSDHVQYKETEAFNTYFELNVKKKLIVVPEVESILKLIAKELTELRAVSGTI